MQWKIFLQHIHRIHRISYNSSLKNLDPGKDFIEKGTYISAQGTLTYLYASTHQLGKTLRKNSHPGMTTINVSWKPYVRHVWLYGVFETIHKTIQKQTQKHPLHILSLTLSCINNNS